MTDYTNTIRQWATDTRRTGTLPDADGTGEVGLAAGETGSRLAVRFTLKVDLDRIVDVRYQVFGCGFTMAACAVAADLAVGYSLDEAQRIDAKQLDSALQGLPDERSYCADLATKALQAAVKSALSNQVTVQTSLEDDSEHGPRVGPDNPVYCALLCSSQPKTLSDVDRHLFACVLAAAAQEPYAPTAALGLSDNSLNALLDTFFPGSRSVFIEHCAKPATEAPPEHNAEVLELLLSHRPTSTGTRELRIATWLVHIITARSALPGHLWVAMGLFQRSELTAAIQRHLPSLADANNRGMRWKKYLFKQICDRNGATMCQAPNCGVCSDHDLCFVTE